MLFNPGQDTFDVVTNLGEVEWASRSLVMKFSDVETERRTKYSYPLPRQQFANGTFEFLNHCTRQELSKSTAVLFAIGMAIRHLCEGLARFEFCQGNFNAGASVVFALLCIDMLHDMGSFENGATSKVPAIFLIEILKGRECWLFGLGRHFSGRSLHAQIPLDPFANVAVSISVTAISHSLLHFKLVLDLCCVHGPRVASGNLFDQHDIYRREFGLCSNTLSPLGLLGNIPPLRVTTNSYLFITN
jgi:hypothetical protein